MGRQLRIQYPGAFYHVTSRGNERKVIFSSKRDREQFLSYLESAYERYGAVIHVFCLMSNHYHLLLETPRSNLSQIMHHINSRRCLHPPSWLVRISYAWLERNGLVSRMLTEGISRPKRDNESKWGRFLTCAFKTCYHLLISEN